MTATRKGGPDCIQDERRGRAGERGEAEEACGQEHDGNAQRDGGILKIDWPISDQILITPELSYALHYSWQLMKE